MMMETLPAGTILRGRYRVERALGSGGFGHVYLATDLQSSQQFAVKEYLVTGASGKAQLEHEARVLSQLRHPSLPAFQDAFDEGGRYYIVLGYIEGNDLTDCIRVARQKNEAISIERILRWLLSICEAVTFLHNQNPPVIHRDIKPDNIRITPDGVAILVDLGNAKAAADGARTLFFIRHQGTPGYAPLEQYPGGAGTDTRSDVYALGGTLYFALTAHEPPSVSTRNTSISQGLPDLPLLKDIVAQNPPESTLEPSAEKQFRLGINKPSKPVSRHSRHVAQLGMLPPDLLNKLNSIIHRAMAMKQKDRYQSVAELSNDLRQVLLALPSSLSQPVSSQGRPIDPHSTQPDLPFLFESLQQGQAGALQQAAQDAPGAPSPVKPASTAPSTQRCPRCQAELPTSATFCPRCGSPLRGSSPSNSQRSASSQSAAPISTDMASEPTMQYRPSQMPAKPNAPNVSTSTTSKPPAQNMVRPASMPVQSPARSSAAPSLAPRPFLQTIAPPLTTEQNYTQGQKTAPSSPKKEQNPPALQQAAGAGNINTQQILFFLVIAFMVILIVVVLLLLTHHGG